MMVSAEEKRWVVVGIAMNKVVAPVLRDSLKQEMDNHYKNLDTYCSGLNTPCTLKTLTYLYASTDPILKSLKLQNVNNNLHVHNKNIKLYNYNINSSVDLAKLYLPNYLAQFTAFDDSLDMLATLRLLGFNNYLPIPIYSPQTQTSADDVRENVRNKWGHFHVTEWTEAFFKDCFGKLETLVRSLGLTAGVEKKTLDQLADWQTKGCHLFTGQAVDKDASFQVQQEVKGLIKAYSNIRSKLSEHEKCFEEASVIRSEEVRRILERLLSFEKIISEMLVRLQAVEDNLAETDNRVEQLEQGYTETADKVEQLEQRCDKADDKVKQLEQSYGKTIEKMEQLEQGFTGAVEKVEQLEKEVKSQRLQAVKPETSPVEPFDVKTCRSKLAEYYQRTATLHTCVWSEASAVDIHQLYTRPSWVKQEQTPAGLSQPELTHYSDLLTANKDGVVPKRILVQGQTGIGKSTFVKKLTVDWAELDGEKTGDEQTAVLKKFELVVAVNLKEVSKSQSLKDVISRSSIFAEEDKSLIEGLLHYITNNQEKVLLVFDGYDEYHSGRNSEIREIFRGKKLRDCCVLITTRISKADELHSEFKVLHAVITGFSSEDTKVFMRRMFDSEAQAMDLHRQLRQKNLLGLAKNPLLLLFFCTLWKNSQLKSFPKTKTKLFMAIVQYILDHSQGKHSPPRTGKVQDFKEILAEIGQVALQGLLKDDHVFEYDQLSAGIRCQESSIIDLLQVTEYAESLRPAGVVPFSHKSVQEFVAAWYITYRCIPEGNLGPVEEHARALEDCEALENVFQFVCGFSDEGAAKVFKHLESVRSSDPSVDLSTTVPDVENEPDVPLCDVTERQRRFSGLVLDSFQEVQSKAELSRNCFDCIGRIMLVTRPLSHLPEVKDLKSWSFLFDNSFNDTVTRLNESLQLLNNESSELLKVCTFLNTFLTIKCDHSKLERCSFHSCLCFRDGQVYIYVTDLRLVCSTHVNRFTEDAKTTGSSDSTYLCSELFSLKFLKSLTCINSIDHLNFKTFGGIIRKCQHLKSIELCSSDNYLCNILKHVPNSETCALNIGRFPERGGPNIPCNMKTAGAEQLADLLPRFPNTIIVALDLKDCSAAAVTTLFSSIAHRNLTRLLLMGIRMTPAVATTLGQSLPELSSLEVLKLIGTEGDITLQTADVEAFFGGFNKFYPLRRLCLSCFSMRGALAPLNKALSFFPKLETLCLEELNLDESDLCGLLESVSFIPNLFSLSLNGNPLGHAVRSIVPYITKLTKLDYLCLVGTDCSEEDRIYVREAVKRVRPRLMSWP